MSLRSGTQIERVAVHVDPRVVEFAAVPLELPLPAVVEILPLGIEDRQVVVVKAARHLVPLLLLRVVDHDRLLAVLLSPA